MIPQHANKMFQGKIFSVWQWDQELYDGSLATFEAIKRSSTSHTVGVLPDGQVLLVEDEQPHRRAVITPPGGMIDPGETPDAAAKREFLEETGYKVGTLVPWHEYDPSVKTEWTVYAFVGRDLEKVGEPNLEAGEKIRLLTYSFDDFLALGHNPKVRDYTLRIILLEAQLDPVKRKELKQLLYGDSR